MAQNTESTPTSQLLDAAVAALEKLESLVGSDLIPASEVRHEIRGLKKAIKRITA